MFQRKSVQSYAIGCCCMYKAQKEMMLSVVTFDSVCILDAVVCFSTISVLPHTALLYRNGFGNEYFVPWNVLIFHLCKQLCCF